MTLKKIFIISTVILIFVSIFSGIYFLVFKKSSTTSQIINSPKENNFGSSETINSKIIRVTSTPIISAAINETDGTIYYYQKSDGTLWNITNQSTNTQQVINEKLSDIKSINWSKDSEFAIIDFDDGNIRIIDHKTGNKTELKKNADSAGWANINNKIIYKYYEEKTKERSLNISDLDGSNWKKLTDVDFRYVNFQKIASSIQLAFWPKADASTNTKLLKINITGTGTPQEIFSNKFGADYLFSPDGSKFIVSYVTKENGKKMNLGVANNQGKEYKDLNIPTLVQKVVWSKDGNVIYYAQPGESPSESVMPNDYLENKFFTQDTFWKMDLKTGKKERLINLDELTEQIDAVNLFLSKTENALFFINKRNSLLYRINMD